MSLNKTGICPMMRKFNLIDFIDLIDQIEF